MERSDGSRDFMNLEDGIADNAHFDASQYTFFGEDVLRGVGLGGLEDDENISAFGTTDNEYQFEKEESGALGSLSDIDDLATTFSKLNKNVVGPKNIGVIGDRSSGSFSRESPASFTGDFTREVDHCNWLDLHIFEMEGKRWGPHLSSGSSLDSKPPLFRASSYPEQILIPKTPFASFPPPSTRSTQPDLPCHLTRHSIGGSLQLQLPLSSPNLSHLSNRNIHSPPLHYPASINIPPQFAQPHWNNIYDAKIPPHLTGHSFYTYLPHTHFMSQTYNSYPLPTQKPMQPIHGLGKYKSTRKGKQISSRPDACIQKNDSGSLQFKSKYMSGEEIEGILKIQHPASHSNNDSYIDDYYHQARVAKNSPNPNHRFCPAHLRDFPSLRGRNNKPDSQHPDVIKIRRPQPLLEDLNSSNVDNLLEKPLEKEPMLAARITLEDCLIVILDVDDIDRILKFNQAHDGGAQLRRKRQALLEGVALALELVDPMVETGARDDTVFLRLISLPKGRKLFSKFLRLLFPGCQLSRIVCMAIFRHLRFLFGSPGDAEKMETAADLGKAVSRCVSEMDLHALSACLIAIVCSSERPPLRPLGGRAGDGATALVQSVLERATFLLNDFHGGGGSNRALWQASFDAFFGLLSKYCHQKYEGIVRSLVQERSAEGMGADLGRAISREMPIEILRASLPHTNEQQRNLLLDFVQRSMMNSEGGGGGDTHIVSESIMLLNR